MILSEQKHSYILVSVFAGGGWGAGQEVRDKERQTNGQKRHIH